MIFSTIHLISLGSSFFHLGNERMILTLHSSSEFLKSRMSEINVRIVIVDAFIEIQYGISEVV